MTDRELLLTALEQPRFLNQVERFASKIKHATITPLSVGDLTNIGWTASRDALDRYDPERGQVMPFLVIYAKTAIKNAVRSEMSLTARENLYGEEQVIRGEDQTDITRIENRMDCDTILKALEHDPDGLQMVELWMDGATLKEIGLHMNYVPSWIFTRLAGCMTRCRGSVWEDLLTVKD